jgi:hypothetical protein
MEKMERIGLGRISDQSDGQPIEQPEEKWYIAVISENPS